MSELERLINETPHPRCLNIHQYWCLKIKCKLCECVDYYIPESEINLKQCRMIKCHRHSDLVCQLHCVKPDRRKNIYYCSYNDEFGGG